MRKKKKKNKHEKPYVKCVAYDETLTAAHGVETKIQRLLPGDYQVQPPLGPCLILINPFIEKVSQTS